MNAITFDTHAHIKKLKEQGIAEKQAEAFVEMVKEAQEINASALATKADLTELRNTTKADLAELKAEIIKWVVGMGFAQVALTLSILKLH